MMAGKATAGPRLAAILDQVGWSSAYPEFPSTQHWADWYEALLGKIEEFDFEDRLRSRLLGKRSQFDGAIAELLAASWFAQEGFVVEDEDPPGRGSTIGEFCVRFHDTSSIFVEVKNPGWELELDAQELLSDRTKRPKYINEAARAFDFMEGVRFAIDKAQSKFPLNQPSLLVVVPDQFVSCFDFPEIAVEELNLLSRSMSAAQPSALLVLEPISRSSGPVRVESLFAANACALAGPCEIPESARRQLVKAVTVGSD